MTSKISQRTGIETMALLNGSDFGTYSIAQRMSWAATRQTTRVEDEAYCLLGIFDVNMPLIYGEGRKAFFRLQEELLRSSDDASIFAYEAVESIVAGPTTLKISNLGNAIRVSGSVDAEMYTGGDEQQQVGTVGLFSSSPKCFRDAAHFIPYSVSLSQAELHPRTVTTAPRLPLSFKLSRHFVEFQVPLWRVPVRMFRESESMGNTDKSSNLRILHDVSKAYGICLTALSIQKLRKCVQAADSEEWTIAFLNCQQRNGGAVGIMLHETNRPGIYVRHHFPSKIEKDHALSAQHTASMQVWTIYIEADSVSLLSIGLILRYFIRRGPVWLKL